ncbi:hypothetical protein PsYK624_007320 [Phanerochaete sordida]|uniref:Uncharacterized protein n=1 Tax=Phanerochaete sordida TaxID=48140 RepID=A0A9P3L742_9APHY|nr:hypothetical protein PsYK624_007320 [Phanerochaete sordida]
MLKSAGGVKAVKLWFNYEWHSATQDKRSVHVKRVLAGIEKEDFPQYLSFELASAAAPIPGSVRYMKWDYDRATMVPFAAICWGSSDATGTVTYLATHQIISIRQLRTPKKGTSRSRRFVVDGQTYKWKIMPNGVDLRCFIDGGLRSDNVVAEWKDEDRTMWADSMSEELREKVVLSLYLNLYYISIGQW